MNHTDYMRYALRLSMRHQGMTAPNPSVGCVIVQGENIVGIGITSAGGRPHAEINALNMAGIHAKNATAYITLEPCMHHRTGTLCCTDALIGSGISECFIAVTDMDTRTHNQGIEKLQRAGIIVHVGLLGAECWASHRAFFMRITENRPFITIKSAMSLDGKITYPVGDNRKKLTSDNAHKRSHLLRSHCDAIAVGIGTILADNPRLDCRLSGLEHTSPDVVIFDTHIRTPTDADILHPTANKRIFLFHGENVHNPLKSLRPDIIYAPLSQHLSRAMNFLSEQGINHLLLEGGAKLSTAFINNNLYDEMALFTANIIMGDTAKNGFCSVDMPQFLQLNYTDSDGLVFYKKHKTSH